MVTKIWQAALWFAAVICAAAGVITIMGGPGNTGEAASLGRVHFVFGSIFLVLAAISATATWLARNSRAWLAISAASLLGALPVALFAAFWIDMEQGEVRRRQMEAEVRSGKHAFGDHPALLAVARAMAANDQEAIRAAAKAVPDLQAAGRDGATLLCWAVRQTWQRPQLAEAVRTLLAAGADPNHTNGQRESLAMANAVNAPAAVLAAMLEAGGDPNARDEIGRPMILMIWYLGYYPDQQRARLELLVERGADVNATMPVRGSEDDGYSVLLVRTATGPRDPRAYGDVLYLLERGADPHRAGADGMTLARMLSQQRERFGNAAAPPGFTRLWDWMQAHGLLSAPAR